MEHGRLIDIIQKTAKRRVLDASSSSSSSSSSVQQQQPPPLVVADMMAGVGPFAVPLAVPPPAPNANANQQPAVPKVAGKRVTLPKETPPASAVATGRRIVVHANGSYLVLS
jgi:hypothetical protein